MSIRSDRIKSLIENSGKTYQELEKVTGIKKSSLQRYASGATAKIPLDVIERLSVFFNVSKEYLMGWEDEEVRFTHSMEAYSIARAALAEPTLTEGEKMWMELYHRLSDETRALLIETMGSFDSLSEDEQKFALRMLRGALRNQ